MDSARSDSHSESSKLSVPANHVTRLIAANRIDLTEPLRWRGRLREDPLVMPWGRRYEIDVEQVESAGQILAASGGLRANIYNNPQAADRDCRDDFEQATGSKPSFARGRHEIFSIRAHSTCTAISHVRESI